MTESQPTFTLNDFPTEIIEKFLPDKRPTTMSALKLVSKRFYYIFSCDYYYKFYLHFPENYYLCEAKCEKNSGKEVFKEIESGSVGKWKGYLSIENIHLKNWSKGEITHTEIVPLGNADDGFYFPSVWQELIDEDSEHWLLNINCRGAIVLLNITDKPKMLVYPLDSGPQYDVKLLSKQVICLYLVRSQVRVFDIVYDGNVISLQYKFGFNLNEPCSWDILSGKCESDGSYKNMFVHGLSDNSGILHFRDLKSGSVLDDICFRDYKFLNSYANGDNAYFELLTGQPYSKVEFPYILVTIRGIQHCKTSVIFNVDKMQVTTFFNLPNPSVSKCYIRCNIAYIFLSVANSGSFGFENVHCVSLERSCVDIEKLTTPKVLCQNEDTSSFYDIALSKHLKFAYNNPDNDNKVHVMSIQDFKVSDVEVFLDINDEFRILGVIGPDMLIIETCGDGNIISFKIPKEGGGLCKKVVDFGRVIAGNDTLCHTLQPNFDLELASENLLDLVSLSKLVLSYNNEMNVACLAIVHF